VVPVLVLVAMAGVVTLGLVWSRRARSRQRTTGAHPDEPARLIDDDTRNALTTGVDLGHTWVASDRAARARAVTEQARHSRWD
jgi:hypothetical protein